MEYTSTEEINQELSIQHLIRLESELKGIELRFLKSRLENPYVVKTIDPVIIPTSEAKGLLKELTNFLCRGECFIYVNPRHRNCPAITLKIEGLLNEIRRLYNIATDEIVNFGVFKPL